MEVIHPKFGNSTKVRRLYEASLKYSEIQNNRRQQENANFRVGLKALRRGWLGSRKRHDTVTQVVVV